MSAQKSCTRKVHSVGDSLVVVIHSDIVKKAGLDDMTFLEQELQADGTIIMRPRRLS